MNGGGGLERLDHAKQRVEGQNKQGSRERTTLLDASRDAEPREDAAAENDVDRAGGIEDSESEDEGEGEPHGMKDESNPSMLKTRKGCTNITRQHESGKTP